MVNKVREVFVPFQPVHVRNIVLFFFALCKSVQEKKSVF